MTAAGPPRGVVHALDRRRGIAVATPLDGATPRGYGGGFGCLSRNVRAPEDLGGGPRLRGAGDGYGPLALDATEHAAGGGGGRFEVHGAVTRRADGRRRGAPARRSSRSSSMLTRPVPPAGGGAADVARRRPDSGLEAPNDLAAACPGRPATGWSCSSRYRRRLFPRAAALTPARLSGVGARHRGPAAGDDDSPKLGRRPQTRSRPRGRRAAGLRMRRSGSSRYDLAGSVRGGRDRDRRRLLRARRPLHGSRCHGRAGGGGLRGTESR